MLDYIREIQRQFVDVYHFAEHPSMPGIPAPNTVPDGEYPMTINERGDRVRVRDGKIFCLRRRYRYRWSMPDLDVSWCRGIYLVRNTSVPEDLAVFTDRGGRFLGAMRLTPHSRPRP